jgi:hypothetical protein
VINYNKIQNNIYLFFNNLKAYFSDVFAYFYIKLYLIILIIINLIIWLLSNYINRQIGNELMYLHYNVDFGVDLIGESRNIFIVPLLGLAIIIVNFILYGNISKYKNRKFISHILFMGAMVSNIILLISVILVYLINF